MNMGGRRKLKGEDRRRENDEAGRAHRGWVGARGRGGEGEEGGREDREGIARFGDDRRRRLEARLHPLAGKVAKAASGRP